MESIEKTALASGIEVYVCPTCKRHLRHEKDSLRCDTCSREYAISHGVPEFVSEELWRSKDPVLRRMTAIDKMARIYETKLWYPIVMAVYGGARSPSMAELIRKVCRDIEPASGAVLDVACGPGTFGRHAASASRPVFGIDVSRGMLRQGAAYTAKEGVTNMHFARARVEALPFESGFFGAVICCGSLHLFADTAMALREIARVMKPGAILSVFTFTAGDGGILKYRRAREWGKKHGMHVFELAEIKQYLADSGFEGFRPEVAGSVLQFSALRRAS